jgi:hypothetical protein
MTGVTIHIKFTNRNTASNPTLNINGLGAKNIFRISSPITGQDNTKSWHNGSVASFTYDGNQWIMNDYTEASDGKVTHSPYTGDYNYRILLGGDDDLLDYGGVGKSQYATFNPSKKAFTFGSRTNGNPIGEYSITEGCQNTARGNYAHAEGYWSCANGYASHSEGEGTVASEYYSHAEGRDTTSSGEASHSEGYFTVASGDYSHSEGYYTTAQRAYQHVFGKYNELDTEGANGSATGKYIEIVGNGTGVSTNQRSNARTLDWHGNEWLAGELTAKDLVLPSDRTWDGTHQSLLRAFATRQKKLDYGTKVINFTNGTAMVDWSELRESGTGKIGTMVLTCQEPSFALRYDFDNSTSTQAKIDIVGNNSYAGNVRFCYIIPST